MTKTTTRAILATQLEQLKNTASLNTLTGEYHDSNSIYEVLYSLLNEYGEKEDEINDCEDIEDDLQEICDSQTPIYNNDRAKWFGENWSAYDEISDEFGKDGMGEDIMQSIGFVYCITLEREAREAFDSLLEQVKED